jgi:hypothetical protein
LALLASLAVDSWTLPFSCATTDNRWQIEEETLE